VCVLEIWLAKLYVANKEMLTTTKISNTGNFLILILQLTQASARSEMQRNFASLWTQLSDHKF